MGYTKSTPNKNSGKVNISKSSPTTTKQGADKRSKGKPSKK